MEDCSTRDDRTIYVKNLDSKVTEEILFELFLQAGPLVGVKRPKDSEGNARPFAFVEFEHDVSPPYARSLMDGIRLFSRNINVQFRSGSRHCQGSQGNSPLATSSYNASSGRSPAPNGSLSFPTPPMVQRSMSVPQGLLGLGPGLPPGLPGAGFGIPTPLMRNPTVPEFFLGLAPGLVPLMQQPQFINENLNGHPVQHVQDRLGETPQRHHHRGRSSQEHQRSNQGSEEEEKSRSHHQDSHRHGHSGSGRHDDRNHSGRGQYSEERRHGSGQRHYSHQEHRQERRDHPYKR